jgi:hypothetical protein
MRHPLNLLIQLVNINYDNILKKKYEYHFRHQL